MSACPDLDDLAREWLIPPRAEYPTAADLAAAEPEAFARAQLLPSILDAETWAILFDQESLP